MRRARGCAPGRVPTPEEPGRDRGADFTVDGVVRFTEERAPLRVADDHPRGAGVPNHRRTHLPGEGALALPVEILRGDHDVAVARGLGGGMDGSERRGQNDLDVADVLHQAAKLFDVLHGVGHRLVHLPVPADEWELHEIQNAEFRMQTLHDRGCQANGLSKRFLHSAFKIQHYQCI